MGRMLASMLIPVVFALPCAAQPTPPDEPQLLSSSLWCGADGVKTVGSTAYVTYWNGIAVLDTADRATPRLLGKSGSVGWCYGLDVSGNFAFLAQGEDGMRVVDVSDPTAPAEVARYDAIPHVNQVIVRDGLAYLTGMDTGGLEIVDVSDPTAPAHVGACDLGGRISLDGDYAYAAIGHEGVAVIDISDPGAPHVAAIWPVAFVSDVQAAAGRVYAVWISGQVPSFDPSGILIYDATDPLNPIYLGGYDSPEEPVRGVRVVGGACYVPSDRKVLILDVSDPAAPRLAGRLQTGGDPSCVDVQDGLAAIADGWGGFRMADVSDPENPFLLGTYCEANVTSDVTFGERTAYVADAVFGVHILDVRDPIHPIAAGRIPLKGGADAVAESEPYIFTMARDGWIDVVDVADPEAPVHAGHLALDAELRDFDLDGSRAYSASRNLFRTIDVADPERPVVLGSCALPDWAWHVRAHGDFAYVGNGYSGLVVVDVSDPSQPFVRGSLNIYEWVFDLATDGQVVYANLDDNRLGVFDVADPDHPAQILNLQMPGFLQDMELVGDRLFCAADPGVIVLDVTNPAAPVTLGRVRAHGSSLDLHGPFVGLAGGGSFEILGPEAAGVAEGARDGAEIGLAFANPVRGGTARIELALGAAQPVRVAVFDVLGRRVATVCDRSLPAGTSLVSWDARSVPAGLYYVRADGARRSVSRSALLLE